MKVIHLTLVLCYCVHSSFGAQRLRQPAPNWKSNAATIASPTETKLSKQAHRNQHTQAQLNERNFTLPLLVNSTQVGGALEKEDDGKEYDHKHRVLLAVQSDVKVRDRVKQHESIKNIAQRNDVPDSRKRLKDGLRDLIAKLHPAYPNSDSSVEGSELAKETAPNVSKPRRPLPNKSKKRQRPKTLKMIECEDIPRSEALLNSALLNDLENAKRKTQKRIGTVSTTATGNIENLAALRKKLLKSRRNQLQMLSPYRGFPPFIWSPNATPYNHFNLHNPYSYFDCNYFLNPLNDVGAPTIEYIWEDYDDADDSSVDDLLKNNLNNKSDTKL